MTAATAKSPSPRRRKSLRLHLETSVSADLSGSRSVAARVRDLAVGGAFLNTDQPFHMNEKVHVRIPQGAQPFQCDAIVRNVMPAGIGVEFVQLQPEDHERLRLLMAGLMN